MQQDFGRNFGWDRKLFYAFGFCYTETENTETDFGFLLKEKEFRPKGRFRQKISVSFALYSGDFKNEDNLINKDDLKKEDDLRN